MSTMFCIKMVTKQCCAALVYHCIVMTEHHQKLQMKAVLNLEVLLTKNLLGASFYSMTAAAKKMKDHCH